MIGKLELPKKEGTVSFDIRPKIQKLFTSHETITYTITRALYPLYTL